MAKTLHVPKTTHGRSYVNPFRLLAPKISKLLWLYNCDLGFIGVNVFLSIHTYKFLKKLPSVYKMLLTITLE